MPVRYSAYTRRLPNGRHEYGTAHSVPGQMLHHKIRFGDSGTFEAACIEADRLLDNKILLTQRMDEWATDKRKSA